MLNKDTLDALVKLGRETDKVEVIAIPGNPREALVRHGQQLETREVPAPLRGPAIKSVEDFMALLKTPSIAQKPEVYYQGSGLSAFLDADDRREMVRLKVAFTEQWKATFELGKGKVFSQKDAIKWLKFAVSGAVPNELISALRKIDFQRNSTGKSNQEHGRESLGKTVETIVQQADLIPQEFTITTQVATNRGLQGIRVEVIVGVHLNVEEMTIEFRPLAGQLTKASEEFERQIGEILTAGLPGIPCFCGEAIDDDNPLLQS